MTTWRLTLASIAARLQDTARKGSVLTPEQIKDRVRRLRVELEALEALL